ncbi:G-type lectin S-receptor-like serine/threonine-protein kinase SD2-5 isoform X2 [Corylus avellana]|uniref:G-type lectin S-receptor-like serine/threonine-protein kinase SD2-5 isoform X2 n=1 Tax=Corylus avellana TaxID=13451 RepID=UPI00286CEDD0|nr:G-type lectin S-receptor-like serine/threonine-protein kinase SD2-5 isoform X2 [Corylus avellana]
MKLYSFIFLILLLTHGYCKSDFRTGSPLMLAVPVDYSAGFIGRAFLMDTNQRVWNSGHYSRFYTWDKCVLELTDDGDLRLMGPNEQVGWRTGTSGQGVERLEIQSSGNLVLVDTLNRIKWQSFNFPTDVMLWGQRLNVATRLTSFPSNSDSFYTFEIHHNKIALHLTSGKWNYSYWEFKPSYNRNITYVKVASKGLVLFSDEYKKIAQIPSQAPEPLRFLALGNSTGNLGFYFYSPGEGKFEAAFQALNTTCDLPLACKPYGICTFSNACSCMRGLMGEKSTNSNCSVGISGGFCGIISKPEMLELDGISSVLQNASKKVNVSKETCENLCLDDCTCAAALYSSGRGEKTQQRECHHYRLVMGVKQVEKGSGLSYMVKVPKGTRGSHGKSNVKKWVLIMVGVIDGLIILLVLGGLGYYSIQKRRENSTQH